MSLIKFPITPGVGLGTDYRSAQEGRSYRAFDPVTLDDSVGLVPAPYLLLDEEGDE